MNERFADRRLFIAAPLCSLLIGLSASGQTSHPITIDERPAWTTSRVEGSPEPPLPYRARRVFPNLSFHQPTVITSAPGTDRLFVAESSHGRIYSIPDQPDCDQADLFLDVGKLVERMNQAADESDAVNLAAIYGLTFHPDFANNRRFYVCYVVGMKNSDPAQHPRGTRVVELVADRNDPPQALVESETEIITWLAGGHNGGCLKFGPDGMLYISTGDGGNAFPPDGHTSAQDLTSLLGSILRIDVNRTEDNRAYAIPDDNPFVESGTELISPLPDGTRREIWAYGLRNPWKFSFDRVSGALWVGDVGWELWELIHRVNRGDNFGWSIVEGRQSVRPEQRPGPTPIVPPLLEIPHNEAASITGGFVYRGERLPELKGHYIFGDWETRRFWGISVDGDSLGPRRELVEPTVRIVGFGERNDGELLLLDYDDGSIHELVRNEVADATGAFPHRLSDTGLFDSVHDHTPATGVVSFVINAPAWADHASAERWLGLPGDSSITMHPRPVGVAGSMFNRSMDYPKNAVLMKTLSLEMVQGDPSTSRRIETQLLHFNGYDWRGYSYRWNDEQSDAELVAASGSSSELLIRDDSAVGGERRYKWRFASRMECVRCHNPWAEFSLAFNAPQLNRSLPSGGQNQLDQLYQRGVIRDVVTEVDPNDPFAVADTPIPGSDRPRLIDPLDEAASLDARARSYLHVNCAHCHRFNGGGSARIYLPFDTPIYKTEAADTRPSQGTFGLEDARIIAPADPLRSVLYFRMAKTGSGHMPHIGSQLIDAEGLELVHDWIQNLMPDLELAEKIDKLIALDGATALRDELRDGEKRRWTIARNIAKRDGRSVPTSADMDAALSIAQERSSKESAARQKQQSELLSDILRDPGGAIALARAKRDGTLPFSTAALIVGAATEHENIAVRDLFESFLPDDQRVERLGDSIDPEQLLSLSGDAAEGQKLFSESALSCRNCHRVGKVGLSVGPELTQVGKKLSREKLLDNLLYPSKEIDPKFASWLVLTDSGRAVSGLLLEQTEQEVRLRDAQNREHRIPPDEIDEMFRQQKSIMPEGLLRDLTAQQAADLLAWLESLQ